MGVEQGNPNSIVTSTNNMIMSNSQLQSNLDLGFTLALSAKLISTNMPETPYGIDSWKDQIAAAQSIERDLRD